MTFIAASTTTTPPVSAVWDDKHRKRLYQNQHRFRHTLGMSTMAMIILMYTRKVLMELPVTSQIAMGDFREISNDDDRGMPQQPHLRTPTLSTKPDSLSTWSQNDEWRGSESLLHQLDQRILRNENRGIRWVRPELLPPLRADQQRPLLESTAMNLSEGWRKSPDYFFRVKRMHQRMVWQDEMADPTMATSSEKGPTVDYTQHEYDYPQKVYTLPPLGDYPRLVSMKALLETWPQDNLDHPPSPIQERLIHFDYQNLEDLQAARLFRDARLPFKLYNVPEVSLAGDKWTDEYLSLHFDGRTNDLYPRARGKCQESADQFLPVFSPAVWDVASMGLPPSRDSDYSFEQWAQHANYADKVGLHPHQPHMYYQGWVDREERFRPKSQWSFMSRDLPSFSSPSETFFIFEPESQKGIQCRFGERGLTAATHFDTGRNMVAMVTGAKRYILSPPSQCSKLGIVTKIGNTIYRHSMLNFGHWDARNQTGMPDSEREWLERAGNALAVDTVLKAGEVLYIPSNWFHYITSLQKSAQCNVRNGVDNEGDPYFGGQLEVAEKCESIV